MKNAFRHCIRVEQKDGRLIPYRFEAKALERFAAAGHAGARYGPGSAGITLDFWTDTPVVSWQCEVINELTYGKLEHFDVWENGVLADSIGWDGFSPIHYRRRTSGRGRITVYLPILYELAFADMDFGSWEPVKPEETRLLILGDSIAQGLRGTHPSLGLSVSLARALRMDYLNLAVGGAVHDDLIVGTAPEYRPDRIFVHLGTNDVNRLDPPEESLARIEGCYEDISNRWPGIPVDVVTPVWRSEFSNGTELGGRRLECAKAIHGQMMRVGEKMGFTVYDGMKISPNSMVGLSDHCHPNDLGFQLYLHGLLSAMQETDDRRKEER